MSVARRITTAVSAMWLSRLIAIAVSVLVMPLLFRYLPKDELGTWFLFVQIGAAAMLLDLGVTSTLTRRIAFARGLEGAEETLPRERAAQIAGLVAGAKSLFRLLSIFSLVGTLIVGSIVIYVVDGAKGMDGAIYAAWTILCVGYSLNVGTMLWTAVISGLGYLGTVSVLAIFASIVSLLLQAVCVLLGGGLVALAAVALAGALLLRYSTLRYLRARHPELVEVSTAARTIDGFQLIGPSVRFWLTEIGVVLLLRTDQLFIAGFKDTSLIPAYHAAYTLVFNLALLSLAVGDASSVYLSQLWRDRSPEALHGFVLKNMRIGLSLMLCGSAFLLLMGNDLIAVWLGPQHFVGTTILTTFCATLSLYVAQSLILGYSRATENEIYASCYMSAGGLKLLVTWVLVNLLGLWGVALGTFLAQLLTTNWYVAKTGLARLQIPWGRYLSTVVAPALAVFAATLVAISAVAIWDPWLTRPIERVAAATLAAGVVCLVSVWLLVLDEPLRQRVRDEVRSRLRRMLARSEPATPPGSD